MEYDKRVLLVVTAVLAVIGLGFLTVLVVQKNAKPRFGWVQLGEERFQLKPAGHHSFSYREVPERFKLEVKAEQPLAFGFVSPGTYGRFTHTILNLDFASLPCGSAPVTELTKECTTNPSERYLLFSDPREDIDPKLVARESGPKSAEPSDEMSEVHVRMFEWRCIANCQNLPVSN